MGIEEFYAENGTSGSRCTWSERVVGLPEDQAKALSQAMDDPNIQHAAIARVLKKWGLDLHKDTVARHRRGECKTCAS